MKKILIILIICLICVGCGEKEKSIVTCNYSTVEEGIKLRVVMEFERDNKKEEISKGKFVMIYNYDMSGYELNEEEKDVFFGDIFGGLCDNISSIYSNCKVNILDDGAEIINEFDLKVLSESSNGNFSQKMTLEELKNYMLEQNEFEDMVCNIK